MSKFASGRARGLRAQAPAIAPARATLAAALVAFAAALAAPAHAGTPALQVDFFANGTHLTCPAQDVAFRKETALEVSWQCAGNTTRFRCNVTSAGVFALDVNLVALNCTALSELPPTQSPALIHASGFESI